MLSQSLYHTFRRYRTLQTHKISALPIVILMPHSACNCRCVMCDIWKDNKNLKQLTEDDVKTLLSSLKKFGTQQVLMSGGEALLNPNFFKLCAILRAQNIRITLLSTGLTISRYAQQLVDSVNDIIISLDGHEALHDQIRNLPGAFSKLRLGIDEIRNINPIYRITGRTVIHRLNYRHWSRIVNTAIDIGLDQISFLPADVSSQAFNRAVKWDEPRQHEILLNEEELPMLQSILNDLFLRHKEAFQEGFIAESPAKLQKIYDYYAAFYGLNDYPYKKCNAPWVSTVIEADGTVRPCFFHDAIGNIREQPLDAILNGETALEFRKTLDMSANETCIKCVCYLNLPPRAKPYT
ncbi:MAG TPA: radical SAM protein [Chitinophagaceae bacterium]|nr:radical SAM protein [Chitinophagaceae bacterium]